MNDMLLIEMPIYRPQYKRRIKYGYKNSKEKENLYNVLEMCSEGYCMYCYTRIRVDGKRNGNLEHAIEKKNSDKLIECIPNIGLACTTCNQTFKKRGDQKRRLSENIIREFEEKSKCTLEKRKRCTVPCGALKKMQKHYNASAEGKIILQPMGVKGNETGEPLALQYDVLNMEFRPASNFHTYSEEEKIFIEMHIKHFRLNDPVYKTRQLYDFIRNVIDNNGQMPQYEYNNWVVHQFRKNMETKSSSEILKVCKSIFCIIFTKM